MVALVSLTLTLRWSTSYLCLSDCFFFFLVFLCIIKFQQFDSFWSVTFFVLFTFCLASFILLWFSSFSGNELEFQSQWHWLNFNLFISQLLMLIIAIVKFSYLNFIYCLTGYGSAISTPCSNMSSPTQQTTVITL